MGQQNGVPYQNCRCRGVRGAGIAHVTLAGGLRRLTLPALKLAALIACLLGPTPAQADVTISVSGSANWIEPGVNCPATYQFTGTLDNPYINSWADVENIAQTGAEVAFGGTVTQTATVFSESGCEETVTNQGQLTFLIDTFGQANALYVNTAGATTGGVTGVTYNALFNSSGLTGTAYGCVADNVLCTGGSLTVTAGPPSGGGMQFVTPPNLPSGQAGQPYLPSGQPLTFQVTGVSDPNQVVFLLQQGSTLPPGLTLTSPTLSGTPTQACSFAFAITATDPATGMSISQEFNINISPSPGLTLSISITDSNGNPITRIDPTLPATVNKGGTIKMYAGTTGTAYITVTEQRGGQPITGETPATTIAIQADPSRWHPNHPPANLSSVTSAYPSMSCMWPNATGPNLPGGPGSCSAILNSGNVSADLTITASAVDTINNLTPQSPPVHLGVWLATTYPGITPKTTDPNALVPVGDSGLIVNTTSHQIDGMSIGNYANPIMAKFIGQLETQLDTYVLKDLSLSGPFAQCASLLPITSQSVALPGGGVFDVGGCGSPGGCLLNYKTPHGSHQAGGDIDLSVRPIPSSCRGALEKAITAAAGNLAIARSYVEAGNNPADCGSNGKPGCHWHVRIDITGRPSAVSSLRKKLFESPAQHSRLASSNPPPVATQVQFDPSSSLFTYSYSLTNTLPTTDSVDTFKLFFAGTPLNVQCPSGWVFGALGASQGILWGAASYDPSTPNDVNTVAPINALTPGSSAKGFSLQSQLPPALQIAEVSTFELMVGFDSEEELEAAFDNLPDNSTIDQRFSVAPVDGPAPSPAAMLNNMLGYVTGMVNLRWITDPNLAATLTQQLNTISGAVSAGQTSNAITGLTNFMSSAQSATGLTTDAFNILYYDAQYLIIQLQSTEASVQVSPSSLNFSYQVGGLVPIPQSLSVNSSIASVALSYSASATAYNGAWLTGTGLSGNTPGTITVSVNPAGVPPGTYTGGIIVTAVGGSAVTIPVTLTVTPAPQPPQLQASPTSLTFTYQLGGSAPQSQSISVTNNAAGSTVNYSATVAPSTAAWPSLSSGSGSTPATVIVSLNTYGLTAGNYKATVTIVSLDGSSTVAVPVTLSVTPPPQLQVSSTSLSFTAQAGGPAPAAKTVSITSSATGIPLSYAATVSTSSGGDWLSVSPASGNTPATLSVSVSLGNLGSGTYNGTVSIGNVSVAVTLTVSAASPTVTSLSPSSTTAGQGFVLIVNGTNFILDSVVIWNSTRIETLFSDSSHLLAPVSSDMVASPGSATVQVTNDGKLSNSFPFTINPPAPTLQANPTSLSFAAASGGAAAPQQSVSVTSSVATMPLNYTVTVSTSNGGGWLSATPQGGTSPGSVSVKRATPASTDRIAPS